MSPQCAHVMPLPSFSPPERPASVSWQDRLNAAVSEAEIVSISKDFIAQFGPGEIHQLPEACRPAKFTDADDVTAYAFTLVRHHCEDGAETAALVHRLASFFSNASIRLSQVMAHVRTTADESRESA